MAKQKSNKNHGWFAPSVKIKDTRWQRLENHCVALIHNKNLRRRIIHIIFEKPTQSDEVHKKIIGKTIVKIYDPTETNKEIYLSEGVAYCSKKDQFNKQHARTIATGRAVKKLKRIIDKYN